MAIIRNQSSLWCPVLGILICITHRPSAARCRCQGYTVARSPAGTRRKSEGRSALRGTVARSGLGSGIPVMVLASGRPGNADLHPCSATPTPAAMAARIAAVAIWSSAI
jgi:hypothetical protein